MVAAIDWTNVLVALIAGAPAIIAAFYAREGHRTAKRVQEDVQTPSGDPVGHVVERAHDLAAVNTAAVGSVLKAMDARGTDRPTQTPITAEPTGELKHSVERLNADESSPVHVNGEGSKP